MTDDLVQFVRDRLDEDYEAVCRVLGVNVMAAIRDGRSAPRWIPSPKSDAGIWDTNHQPRVKYAWPRERDHIIRHDPARVLADVEAKRQILAAYESWQARIEEGEGLSEFERGSMAGLYAALRILADAYQCEERRP